MSKSVSYKPVVGWIGYRVGDDGTLWSCREGWGKGYGGGKRSVLTGRWRRVAGCIDKKRGYVKVELQPGGRTFDLHRLVLIAFRGLPPAGMQSLYDDGDRTNNRLDNLRWGTPTENSVDRRRHGNMKVGEDALFAKLTNAQVREIRRLYKADKATRRQLRERFRVSRTLIQLIVTDKHRTETRHGKTAHAIRD